jgi:hypothetical protein
LSTLWIFALAIGRLAASGAVNLARLPVQLRMVRFWVLAQRRLMDRAGELVRSLNTVPRITSASPH